VSIFVIICTLIDESREGIASSEKFLSFAILSWLVLSMSTSDKAAQRKALVVGISDYTSLQQLDFCKNDGTEVYEVLTMQLNLLL
jgi:hypothetical protein